MRSAEQTSYTLRGYRLRDSLALPGLVQANADVLAEDFPELPQRHGSWLQSLQTIRGVQQNPGMRAFTVRETSVIANTDFGIAMSAQETGIMPSISMRTRTIGAATAIRGAVRSSEGRIEGVAIAGWLDREYMNRGIGTRVGAQLVAAAVELGKAGDVDHLFTVVRPDNAISAHVVQQLGLEPVGNPGDYSADIGDSVTAQRQLFVLPIDA